MGSVDNFVVMSAVTESEFKTMAYFMNGENDVICGRGVTRCDRSGDPQKGCRPSEGLQDIEGHRKI